MESSPSPFQAFLVFLISQTVSTLYNYISDCDETFNYWEPTHFMQYGRGFQTWEYSPDYALRSYAYLHPQVLVGEMAALAGLSKIHQFYVMRWVLGFACAGSLSILYSGIRRLYNSNVAFITFVLFTFSTGLFISGTAYLPSSYAMYCLAVSLGAWMRAKDHENNAAESNEQPNNEGFYNITLAIIMVALAALVGWPFSALVGLPLALHVLWKVGLGVLLFGSVAGALISLVPTTVFDYMHYKKLVIAPLNIVIYNVIKGGAEMYGISPWYFYLQNCFLNFNGILPFALLAVPVSLLLEGQGRRGYTVYHLPMLIWFLFMSSIPHKEERFMFVVYPQIIFGGAVAFDLIITTFAGLLGGSKKIKKVLTALFLLVVIALSVSRSYSLVNNYSAPVNVYTQFSELQLAKQECEGQVHVCVGKEWYRFPNHYFIPTSNVNVSFIRQGAQSQLPQYYPSTAHEIQPNFNDQNAEEMSRYIPQSQCHYVIDSDNQQKRLLNFPESDWELVHSEPFLDAENSPSLARAFYIPGYSEKKTKWIDYFLLRNKKI